MGNNLSYPEVDLSGKVALVTGGNTGIGYETAKALARLGAHTFIACRSKERAETAIERMKNELSRKGSTSVVKEDSPSQPKADKSEENEVSSTNKTGNSEDQQVSGKPSSGGEEVRVEYLPLDLASFQSTKECVRLFKERNLPLHILINNAAVSGIPFTTTGDNLEAQFQINHLGPMLFTLELLPVLLETASSSQDVRIIFVSSMGHTYAEPFNPETINKTDADQYHRLKLYCNTKLYNVMTGYSLQRRLQNKGITVSSVHPGYVRTELVRNLEDRKFLMAVHKVAVNVVGRTPVEGAATSLNCAVNSQLNSQQHFYYDSCRPKLSSSNSRNEVYQEQLWEKSFEFFKDHLSLHTIENYGPVQKEVPQEPKATTDTPIPNQEVEGEDLESQQKSSPKDTPKESN